MAIDWPVYGEARYDEKLLSGLLALEARGEAAFLPPGDGVTDMGATINAAIDATSEGDAVVFPSGTYIVETPVLLRQRRSYRAVGEVTLLQKAHTTMDAVVMVHPDEPLPRRDIYWDSIHIDGNADTVDGAIPLNVRYGAGSGFDANHGMRLAGLQFSRFDNLAIRHCGGDGLVLQGVDPQAEDGFSVFSEQTSTLHFHDPYIYDCGRYSVQFGLYADDNHIHGGDLGYSGFDGAIFLSGSSSLRQTTVWGSRQGSGVVLGASSNQLLGCQIEGHAQHGVKVTTRFANYTYIQGCKIYYNSAEASESYDGVYVNGDPGYVNTAGADATEPTLTWTPPGVDFTSAPLSFTLNTQAITLNADYTDMAGLASAIDGMLDATLAAVADGADVVVTAAPGAGYIMVAGADMATVLDTATNVWGTDATAAEMRWRPAADGDYSGGAAISFTLGGQAITLNADYADPAGVAAAIDAQTTVFTSVEDLGAVVVRLPAGSATIVVAGADAADITGAAGAPVSYVSIDGCKIYGGIGDFYLNEDHNVDPDAGGGYLDGEGNWVPGPGWVGQRHSITLDVNHQFCSISGNDVSFSQPGAGAIDDGIVAPSALRHGGPDTAKLDIFGLKAGDTLDGTYFCTQAEIDARMGASPRTLEPGRTLFLPASGDLVYHTGAARDSVERLLTHGHDVTGGTLSPTVGQTSWAVSFPDRLDSSYTPVAAPDWSTTVWFTDITSTGFTIHAGTAAPGSQTLHWALVRI